MIDSLSHVELLLLAFAAFLALTEHDYFCSMVYRWPVVIEANASMALDFKLLL